VILFLASLALFTGLASGRGVEFNPCWTQNLGGGYWG